MFHSIKEWILCWIFLSCLVLVLLLKERFVGFLGSLRDVGAFSLITVFSLVLVVFVFCLVGGLFLCSCFGWGF